MYYGLGVSKIGDSRLVQTEIMSYFLVTNCNEKSRQGLLSKQSVCSGGGHPYKEMYINERPSESQTDIIGLSLHLSLVIGIWKPKLFNVNNSELLLLQLCSFPMDFRVGNSTTVASLLLCLP